jgi:dihydrofolate reductase
MIVSETACILPLVWLTYNQLQKTTGCNLLEDRRWEETAVRKLIVWNIVTLDGYFEGRNKWQIDFHNLVWGAELEQLCRTFGDNTAALIFGRITYEGMASYWTTAEAGEIKTYMNGLPKLVASRTLKQAQWNNSRVTGDIIGEVGRLKQENDGKVLYVFGSADLSDTLLKEGLVDEIMLCVAPTILGGGTPLFKDSRHQHDLSLLEARALRSGGVILRYAPKQEG